MTARLGARARLPIGGGVVGQVSEAWERRCEGWLEVLDTHSRITLTVAMAVSCAVRLPLLFDGYGEDPDAWRVAGVARLMHDTGGYTASRLPGYPLQELASSLLIPFGPVGLNTATMVCSLVAVLFFALVARSAGIRVWAPLAVAAALTPIVLEASTEALDYMWALAPLMVALYAALHNRPAIAGCAVGVAIGCRLTSGAVLLPLAILVNQRRSILRMTVLAAVVGLVAFLPVVLTYGPGFLTFYDGRVRLSEMLRAATVGVWGVVGCIAIGFALIAAFVLGTRLPRTSANSRLALASLTGVALWTVAYVRLPLESAYLIPMIPFVLLLAGLYLRVWVALVLCAGLTLSGLVAVPATRITRVAGIKRIHDVLATASVLPSSAIVVTGYLSPKLEPDVSPELFASRFAYALTQSEIAAARDRGVAVLYTSEGRFSTGQKYGFDIASQTSALLPGE